MDWGLVILLVIGVVALIVGAIWRPTRRATTPEEHLEQAALKAEQDKHKTEAQYRADRYNLRE